MGDDGGGIWSGCSPSLVYSKSAKGQKNRGVSDAGLRSAVTGGAQMDGFITLFRDFVTAHGSTALIAQPRKFF
ncbi:MAG: PaeR7I family type II restriction endonuclease [Pseudomonadota bacterium]